MCATKKKLLPITVLISGRGSNLQSIIDNVSDGRLSVEIRVVISNRPGVLGLERAEKAGIKTRVIDHTLYKSCAEFDLKLQSNIDTFHPELVVLAGFMRILSPAFIDHYRGRLINIHPSLLPDFPGLHTHQRVIDAGAAESGATVHFVTKEVDSGSAILQVRVPVLEGDDADSLARRVLEQEHRLYPLAIRWFAEQRVSQNENGRVILDGKLLSKPLTLLAESNTL